MPAQDAIQLLNLLLENHETREMNGYVQVNLNGEWRWLHRVIAIEKMGADIFDGFEVHHIDGDKQNNHPDNLKVLSKKQHQAIHEKQKKAESTPSNEVRNYISWRIKKIQSERQSISDNADPSISKSTESDLKQSIINKLEVLAAIRKRNTRFPYDNELYSEGHGDRICTRCGGTGYLPEYNHVEAGVCFSCGGSGRN